MKSFATREYPLYELAMLYYPESGVRGACRLFIKDLHETRGLWKALSSVGYKPYTKLLTRPQVRAIVKFLGEP